MKIVSVNTNLVTSKAIETLNLSLELHKNQPILFLVSGGSALTLLNDINKQNLDTHITISVLDERFDKNPEINNFAQLASTNFYKNAIARGCKFIDTTVKNESIEQIAQRFENSIRQWTQEHANGYILITQGIGADGHTSGIMPYPENRDLFVKLFETDSWIVYYNAHNKSDFPLRITTTIPFLKTMVDESIVYAVGDNKKSALNNLFSRGSIAELPARVICDMKKVALFTDIPLLNQR